MVQLLNQVRICSQCVLQVLETLKLSITQEAISYKFYLQHSYAYYH